MGSGGVFCVMGVSRPTSPPEPRLDPHVFSRSHNPFRFAERNSAAHRLTNLLEILLIFLSIQDVEPIVRTCDGPAFKVAFCLSVYP